jgi:hypothetical protein
MTMPVYSGDLTRALKWQHNQAPNITSLIQSKANWYSAFNTQFWSNWQANVFDIRTCNNFGLAVWCIILNVPMGLFGLYGTKYPFGLDQTNAPAINPSYAWRHRQNFKNSAATPPTGANLIGGNFIGGGNTTILNLTEVRAALIMRYLTLCSNGSLQFINDALALVFGKTPFLSTAPTTPYPGNPWNFTGKQYFVCVDTSYNASAGPSTVGAAVTTPMYMEYRVGQSLNISANLINLFNDPVYGKLFMPSNATVKYLVVRMP